MRLAVVQLALFGCMLFAAAPVQAERLEATNSSAVSVDGDTRTIGPAGVPTRSVTFTGLESAFGSGVIQDLYISITFSKLSNNGDLIPDPWYDEIGFALKSPTGTIVELIPINTFAGPGNPAPSNAFNNTAGFSGKVTLDDLAAKFVNAGTPAGKPNVGTFKPMNPLSAFVGQNVKDGLNGTWQLFIEDSRGGNPLQFTSFTLSFQTGPAVPEPGSIALGSMALLALAGYGWRVRRSRNLAAE